MLFITNRTKSQRCLLRVLLAVLLVSLCPSRSFAQNSEHVVILWDVTGSLLPKEKGKKDLDGKELPTFSTGFDLWVDLKKAIIECINYVDGDPGNEITIIPFNDKVLMKRSESASQDGKNSLIDFVTKFGFPGFSNTNIVAPISEFYSLLKRDQINYMFLFTDGTHNHPANKAAFLPILQSWTDKTKGQNAYGFYVRVHQAAVTPEIRNSVDSQDNFWIVEDAKVRVSICSLPSDLKYNVRDERGPVFINYKGRFTNAKGTVRLVANDAYYDVICPESAISNGKLSFEVIPKRGVSPPENHTVLLTPQLSGTDQYTFVGPQEISLEVSNLPERSLNLTIADSRFGKASYHGSFLFSKEKTYPVVSNIKVEFSEQAKNENSSAVMRVYLVDKKNGKEELSPASQNLTISINGSEIKDGSFTLTPAVSDLKLIISGQPNTKSGSYYGRIELVPSNLDNCTINGTPEIFKWRMNFSHNWNPLKLGLAWLIGILAVAFLLWMIILKPIVYPRFGSIHKTFIVPGMAPLIVKFKGTRMVVVAATHPHKQTGWNRFWTGRILYKTHSAFDAPITFKPSKGHKVLAKVQPGTYQVMPNPMPGVGTATIVDIRNNLRINVN